jgi:glutamate dehydrogenase
VREDDSRDDLVEVLVGDYLAAREPHDRDALTAAAAAGAVAALLALGGALGSGRRIVKVGNPTQRDDGWESPHTVVDVVSDDAPFLVDSVSSALARRGYDIHLLFHPLLDVPDRGVTSHLHLEIDRETDLAVLDALRDAIESVVDDVLAAVADWDAMRAAVAAFAAGLRAAPPDGVTPDETAEVATYLDWLAADHFTFVGAVLVDERGEVVEGSALGVARRRPLFELAEVDPEPVGLLTLTRAQTRSTVHRDVPLDSVTVRRLHPDGSNGGELRLLGLYTANVYSDSVESIPVVRHKVARVRADSGFPPGGHDDRTLAHVLAVYPRDELFRLSTDELARLSIAITAMGARRRVRLFVSRDRVGCFVSCLVYMPRDRYTTPVRVQVIEALRDSYGGGDATFNVLLTEEVMARLHIVVETPAGVPEVEATALEPELAALVRTWVDDLHDAFVEARGEEAGIDRYRLWRDAFPPAYRSEVPAATAVTDVEVLESLDPAGDLQLRLEPPAAEAVAHVKLFRAGGALVLSDVMPLLEQLGVTVIDEHPYEITAPDGTLRWIYSFGVVAAAGDPLGDPATQARVADVFLGVWAGTVENDGLNRLVLHAGLDVRDVVIVRALCQYLRQAGVRFTDAYLADTLHDNADAVRLLVARFHARLDPARVRDDALETSLDDELERVIDAVVSLDADRILRALWQVVRATVRTNAYRGEAHLACKLDPTGLDFLPRPRPQHEIWVASPSVEGVHLRAGDVARGGIRWSDRREDFRTEVLGLMKAQTVKNAVIVPVGAKGGFYVKRGDSQAAYETFIRGLLELTDNRVTDAAGEGTVVPPSGVVRRDGDDSYLVVAADKGTGAFSDVANALADEYGYWLGDAFASGGSAGFDHKEMGITSRGAWLSVKAHFRAVGVDADTARLTVVGIGDMSGDVFGNGLLRSPHLQLVAAFDHRHVFVDPDPDPMASFAERQRLFALPRSSWADYDPALLSPGGGVYPRSAKSVDLSPAAQRVLGVADGPLTPDELVRAILLAPVDLLWNGGIGTFVKASTESDADPGDRTNDAVRVDGAELRCRVVGEGGNLGFTQRGRVEYALAGGRINTDAIDNSAGVDTSDHEVNIKILLQRAIATGVLDAAQRDPLLVEMTDAVAELVLADNEAQANALEIAAVEAADLVGVHARQMERLEQTAGLDRALEALPSAKVLQERHAAGLGLTSPELAVLLAYTKLELQRALVASDVPDDPYLDSEFVTYFPSSLQRGFDDALASHPLRREIVATVVANAIVNRAGISFLSRLCDETGLSLPVLARAHAIARDVFDAIETWAQIDALDLVVPASVQDEMFLLVRRLVERAARWLVRHSESLTLGPAIERFRPGVRAVIVALPDLLVGSVADTAATAVARFTAEGVGADLARRVAASDAALVALPAVALALEHDLDPCEVARIQFLLDDRLGLDRLRIRIAALPRADRWQTEARAALRDDLYESQHALTRSVLAETDRAGEPEARVDAWLSDHEIAVGRYRDLVHDVEQADAADLAALAVVRRALRDLAQLQ